MKFPGAVRLMYLPVLLLVVATCAAAAPRPADLAQAFSIQTLDGKTFDLSAERGRWVIVNFWATWCSPCIAEMPAISKFVASHKNVAAIGLAWDRSPRAELVKFARKHPVNYPLAQVDMEHPPSAFAAPLALPTTYLIAPDGQLVKQFTGPVTAKLLEQAIAAASTKSAAAPSASVGR
ncbi:MAG TPA: TlpA disulfide reductase family protein [Rhodanobacteraceae bacterium]|nr:TlpA disulfide reductase family protein [Rhodanobacteraceae bacterium]